MAEKSVAGQQSIGGAFRTAILYLLSSNLLLLNPLLLIQDLFQMAGSVAALLRLRRQPPMPQTSALTVEYRLPFQGRWVIGRGGTTPAHSHSWFLVNQRFAYDFVKVDCHGTLQRERPQRLTDYFAYGEDILAPAHGVVLQVRDGIRDAPWPGSGWLDIFTRDIRGNFVLIQHAKSEYSLLAHLAPKSVVVRPGERVRQGQRVASCGNSGLSTQPHLHFQLQDRPSFAFCLSLPIAFRHYMTNRHGDTSRFLERGIEVEPVEAPAHQVPNLALQPTAGRNETVV